MFSLDADKEGHKLVIKFSDYFDLQQAGEYYARLQKIVPKLKEGFIVLTDLSSLVRMDINAKLFIEKTMSLLNNSGVSKVIRVIPDQEKDIGFNIMSLFHYSPKVQIFTYKSYAEAEKHFK